MIYIIGNMIGFFFIGFICDYFGRWVGMGLGVIIIMVVVIIFIVVKNDFYLFGGWFLLGFGIFIGISLVFIYVFEFVFF